MRSLSISATHIAPRSTLSADRAPVLVAALSGRALAEAARRAGARVHVLDAFADEDTRRFALSVTALPRAPLGFDEKALLAAAAALAPSVRGLVYGAGFEHDPALLGRLAERLPLLGNAPGTVALLKHPMSFAALLAALGLPHPETTLRAPAAAEGTWLRKRMGGAGGGHVAAAAESARAPGDYFQRRVPGAPLSALFIANGTDARVIGFSEQWAAAAADAPFRYGGCAGPISPPEALAAGVADACRRIARAAGLIGLNSIDLLVAKDAWHIIEINPRPGASLDVFDGIGGRSLWRQHLAGIAGRLPASPSAAAGATRAAAVVYAERALALPRAMVWPAWTADRGGPGSRVAAGEPLCTVHAAAKDAAAARRLAERRAGEILLRVAGGSPSARGR